jgi:hypothetical protein
MGERRRIEIEPQGSRWVVRDDAGRSKPFDRQGDAEAWAVSRARTLGGAELVIKNRRGSIERRRAVSADGTNA